MCGVSSLATGGADGGGVGEVGLAEGGGGGEVGRNRREDAAVIGEE